MLNLILALMLTAAYPDSGTINWREFEARLDSVIECAFERTEARLQGRRTEYRETLDSLIHANHQEFRRQLNEGHISFPLLDSNLLLADKREKLRAASHRVRERLKGWQEADLYLSKMAYGGALCDLLAHSQIKAFEAAMEGDALTAEIYMRKADRYGCELIDWLVKMRKEKRRGKE